VSEDVIERIEALRKSLFELEHHVSGVLRRSVASERYADFVRSATDWVWETDANLNYTFLSEGVARVFAVPGQVMEGQYLFSLNHFRQVDETLLGLVDTIQERRPFRNVELGLVSGDGETRKVLLSGVPAFDEESGNFTGYRGTGIDLSRRAHPDEQDEDRAYAEALDAGRVGLWEWNVRTGALHVAPGVDAMLGYAPGGIGDTIENWRRLIHPDDHDAVRIAFDDHLEGRTDELEVENRMLDAGGATRWLVIRGRAIRDASGTPLRIVGACNDITEWRDAEDRMRAATEAAEFANRAKTDFLAHLSHELRTPLNAIIGFSEAIKDGYLGPLSPEKSMEYASDVHVASRHLLDLINDVLDLSKVEAGQTELSEEAIDIEETVRSSIRLIEGRAATESLRLNVEIAENLPRLRADSRLVRQVLLNLLTNAVKFTETGGTVSVRGRQREDGGITLEVSDTGVGIAEENIPKALTPFVQVGADDATRTEGTGLGLPLAKSLVELHGGTLELRSTLGRGTDDTANFPASRNV